MDSTLFVLMILSRINDRRRRRRFAPSLTRSSARTTGIHAIKAALRSVIDLMRRLDQTPAIGLSPSRNPHLARGNLMAFALHHPSASAGRFRSPSPCLDRAAAVSPLGAKPRQLNPEIRQCRAGQQSRWPPQSFSAPPSRHRPRPRIVAPAMPIRRPIIRGAPSPPVMQVAPSPPAIARRPVAPLAAQLVCRPVLRASQGTTPGDERGGVG